MERGSRRGRLLGMRWIFTEVKGGVALNRSVHRTLPPTPGKMVISRFYPTQTALRVCRLPVGYASPCFSAGTGDASQMVSAYSRIARSAEKRPAIAVLTRPICIQWSRSL